jgi:hypothetical protein
VIKEKGGGISKYLLALERGEEGQIGRHRRWGGEEWRERGAVGRRGMERERSVAGESRMSVMGAGHYLCRAG